MLESLPVEQQAIAQQLLRGGIPAVRTALHFERGNGRVKRAVLSRAPKAYWPWRSRSFLV